MAVIDIGSAKPRRGLAPLRAASLEDFVEMALPERPRLLGPWLTKASLTLVHARTGVGKTWFLLSSMLAGALGTAFLKWAAGEPFRVIYLDGEMPGALLQERAAFLLSGRSTEGRFAIVTPDLQDDPMPNLASEEGRDRVEPLLKNADALVVDHIGALMRLHGDGSEGDKWAEQVQPWLLDKRRSGLAILLAHHSGKGGTQRGTSVREDIMDVIIKLEQAGDERDGARFNVVFEKTRGFYGADAETFEAHLTKDQNGNSLWEYCTAGETEEFKAFVEMLRDGKSVEKAARHLKLNRATGFRWKARAIDKGLLL